MTYIKCKEEEPINVEEKLPELGVFLDVLLWSKVSGITNPPNNVHEILSVLQFSESRLGGFTKHAWNHVRINNENKLY